MYGKRNGRDSRQTARMNSKSDFHEKKITPSSRLLAAHWTFSNGRRFLVAHTPSSHDITSWWVELCVRRGFYVLLQSRSLHEKFAVFFSHLQLVCVFFCVCVAYISIYSIIQRYGRQTYGEYREQHLQHKWYWKRQITGWNSARACEFTHIFAWHRLVYGGNAMYAPCVVIFPLTTTTHHLNILLTLPVSFFFSSFRCVYDNSPGGVRVRV